MRSHVLEVSMFFYITTAPKQKNNLRIQLCVRQCMYMDVRGLSWFCCCWNQRHAWPFFVPHSAHSACTGSIPVIFGQLTKLHELNLSENQLTGNGVVVTRLNSYETGPCLIIGSSTVRTANEKHKILWPTRHYDVDIMCLLASCSGCDRWGWFLY